MIHLFQARNFEPIWGLKKDYNRSERFFEEKEKLSRRRTAIQDGPSSSVKKYMTQDELEPLSKKVKVELKEMRQKDIKNKNKIPCDTTANIVPSNLRSTSIDVLRQEGKQIIVTEDDESIPLKSVKPSLSTLAVTESPTGKIFHCSIQTSIMLEYKNEIHTCMDSNNF